MIYVIEAVGTNFIKVGRAKSVGQRLKDLQCASPFELIVVAVANWPDEAERAIHNYLRPCLERYEWFKRESLADEVISFMQAGQWEHFIEKIRNLHDGKWSDPIKQIGNRQAVNLARARRRGLAKGKIPADKRTRREEREAWWRAHGNELKQRNNGPYAEIISRRNSLTA